jgi:uncharacterized membrane protein
MATESLKKTTRIHAPQNKVFAFVTNPEYVPQWMPGIVDVKNIAGPQGTGESWEYHYAFAGTHHKGTAHITEYEQDKQVGVKTQGDLSSEWQFRFDPDGDYTNLTVEIDYDMPATLLSKIEAPLLRKLHNNDAAHALENLKAHLETA